MARKKKDQLEAEAAAARDDEPTVEVEQPGTTEDVDRTTPITRSRRKPAAQPPSPPSSSEVKPKRYTVTRGGKIMHGRTLTILKPGKVVDEREYNIDQLREQGIGLEPIE